jgi:hypothetical protein
MLKIPYTGSSPLVQATLMNKGKAKEILLAKGLPTLPFQIFKSNDILPALKRGVSTSKGECPLASIHPRSKEQGILEVANKALVISATKLKKKEVLEIKNRLSSLFQNKDLRIETLVEAKVLGGLKIQIGSKVIDLSIEGKINKMRDLLTNG